MMEINSKLPRVVTFPGTPPGNLFQEDVELFRGFRPPQAIEEVSHLGEHNTATASRPFPPFRKSARKG